jgi:hypothetical protein
MGNHATSLWSDADQTEIPGTPGGGGYPGEARGPLPLRLCRRSSNRSRPFVDAGAHEGRYPAWCSTRAMHCMQYLRAYDHGFTRSAGSVLVGQQQPPTPHRPSAPPLSTVDMHGARRRPVDRTPFPRRPATWACVHLYPRHPLCDASESVRSHPTLRPTRWPCLRSRVEPQSTFG